MVSNVKTSRDLILEIAKDMKKPEAQFQKFITALEENFLDTTESLKELSDQDFKDMGFPIGIKNAIQKKLAELDTKPVEEVKKDDVQAINTGAPDEISVYDRAMIALDNLKSLNIDATTPDATEARAKIKGIITTLVKVIGNILSSPMEPKYRKLPKKSESVKTKILSNSHAVAFLKIADFRFDSNPDHIEYTEMDKDRLEMCKKALLNFVGKMGGQVQDPNAFDPFKAGISSTTGQAAVPGNAENSGLAKTKGVSDQIKEIQRQRDAELEGKIENREVMIYLAKGRVAGIPSMSQAEVLQQKQSFLDALDKRNSGAPAGDAEMKDETLIDTTGGQSAAAGGVTIGGNGKRVEVSNDDDMKAALAFIKEQDEKKAFRDRLAMELEKEKAKAHHTRTIVKLKFPNDYVLQAVFGQKEQVKDLYEFVRSLLVDKQREFILYTVPPKTVLTKMQNTFKAQGFGRGCNVHFGWKDLDITNVNDGPFLDLMNNRDKMV